MNHCIFKTNMWPWQKNIGMKQTCWMREVNTSSPMCYNDHECFFRAHSLSPTDHQAAFYLALQLAISRQVSLPNVHRTQCTFCVDTLPSAPQFEAVEDFPLFTSGWHGTRRMQDADSSQRNLVFRKENSSLGFGPFEYQPRRHRILVCAFGD